MYAKGKENYYQYLFLKYWRFSIFQKENIKNCKDIFLCNNECRVVLFSEQIYTLNSTYTALALVQQQSWLHTNVRAHLRIHWD